MAEHIVYAVLKSLALNDEQGYQLRLICLARRQLGEVHVLTKQMLLELVHILYLSHSHYGKTSQVGVQHKWLCIGVANHTYAGCSTCKARQCRLKLGAEIRALKVVYRACKRTVRRVVSGHTATAGA